MGRSGFCELCGVVVLDGLFELSVGWVTGRGRVVGAVDAGVVGLLGSVVVAVTEGKIGAVVSSLF